MSSTTTLSEFSSWTPLDTTMVIYISVGLLGIIIISPLIAVILYREKLRKRKESVLIIFSSLVDVSYIIVNVVNSYTRITETQTSVFRIECISKPLIFLSTVVSSLIAIIPIIVAIDRLIFASWGIWYHKQRWPYTLVICFVPISLSSVLAASNFSMMMGSDSRIDVVSAFCFSSSLITPSFRPFFYGSKWIFIILAVVIYGFVVLIFQKNGKLKLPHQQVRQVVRSAHLVLGWNILTAFTLLLIPDLILFYAGDKNLVGMTILYSCIMSKLLINFVGTMILHKELRDEYYYAIFRKSRSGDRIVAVTSRHTTTV